MVDAVTSQQHQVPIIEQVECLKCGYRWFPIRGKLPVVCARCKSYRWNEEKVEKVNTSIVTVKEKVNIYPQKCLHCAYEWVSPREMPKSCPRCRSRVWHQEKVIYPQRTCLQCGYKWFSRYEHSPVCPACQRNDWNKVYPTIPLDEYGNIDYKLGDLPNKKPEEPSEETAEITQTEDEQHYIMKSIEAKLGTSEAGGEHQAIAEKEEHWVEVKSSVVLGVEGKRETRIVNKDEMRKLTGK